MKRSGLPRYVVADTTAAGAPRYLYRAPGRPKITLPGPMGSHAFWQAYAAAQAGLPLPGAPKLPTARRSLAAGSFAWLVEEYLRSGDVRVQDTLTQSDKRGALTSCTREPIAPGDPVTFGEVEARRIEARHIEILRDRKAERPSAGNKRLIYLNLVFKWGKRQGYTGANPVADVPHLSKPAGGHHAWTPAEVAQFEACHEIGTRARLAFALALDTGVRISDLAQMGRQHIRDGWLTMPQHKGRRLRKSTISVPILPALQAMRASDDAREGPRAFAEKRPPRWTGR